MLELGELLLRLIEGFAAWRYIFSKKYRIKTHNRWKNERKIMIVADCAGGVIGIGLTITLFVIILSLLYR